MNIHDELKKHANASKAKLLQGFFKTGKGEYGEGDIFLGIMVPETRKVVKKCINASLSEIKDSLYSKFHEERLCALLILVEQYGKGDEKQKKNIFDFYMNNAKRVNNWDLVDLTAPKIPGEYLLDKPKDILYKFAVSENLWEKRIAVLSTFMFIKHKQYKDSFRIAEILMKDKHDLMHKAIGWMLREIGKRDLKEEEKFLKKHYKKMPRTMLRYAIERFPEEKRKRYLYGRI